MSMQWNPLESGGIDWSRPLAQEVALGKWRDPERKATALEVLGIDIEELEEIIQILKKRKAAQEQPSQVDDRSRCAICGLSWSGPIGYVCQQPGCSLSGPTC